MLDYWANRLNRPPSMLYTNGDWNVQNMKTLLSLMFETGYNLILERGIAKVACAERYNRLSRILENYTPWFQNSHCMPTQTFITGYEERKRKEQIDESSFSGMYTKFISNTPSGNPVKARKPDFQLKRPDAAAIDSLLLMPPALVGPPARANANVPPEDMEQDEADKEQQAAAAIQEQLQKQQQQAAAAMQEQAAREYEIKRSIEKAVLDNVTATTRYWNANNMDVTQARDWITKQAAALPTSSRHELAFEVYSLQRGNNSVGVGMSDTELVAVLQNAFETHWQSSDVDDVAWRKSEYEALHSEHATSHV